MSRAARLDAVLAPLRESDALVRAADEGIALPVARALARAYYPANLASPQILAAGIAHIWDEELRAILVGNLYDECGRLDPSAAHTELFRRFMRAVDVRPESAAGLVAGTRTDRLVRTFLTTCLAGPDYRALAILHGFEDVFAPLCGLIARGLATSNVVDAGAAEFFRLHAVADIAHAERMRVAMMATARTAPEFDECLELARLGAELIHGLFDAIVRAQFPAVSV